MKFEFNWPSGFRDVQNCGRTDTGVTGSGDWYTIGEPKIKFSKMSN